MWIFCKAGFFSVVEHNVDPDTFLVRCRTGHDARVLARFAEAHDAFGAHMWENPRADYRWRVHVTRDAFTTFVTDALLDLHYCTSVKTEIDQCDPVRHEALLRVWAAMMTLQDP